MAIVLSSCSTRMERIRLFCIYGFCLVVCTVGFLLYTCILPGCLFWPTFSGFSRIADFEQLFNANALFSKLLWIGVLAAPLVPILILGQDRFRTEEIPKLHGFLTGFISLALPSTPFVAAILISNLDQMYRYDKYYSILPGLLIAVAAYISVRSVPIEMRRKALLLSCIIASAISAPTAIFGEIKMALRHESPVVRLRSFIPQNAVVVTGDWDAASFIRQPGLMRLYHANRSNPKFDFIVQRKNGSSSSAMTQLSPNLRTWSNVCFEDEVWLVRCAYPSKRAEGHP